MELKNNYSFFSSAILAISIALIFPLNKATSKLTNDAINPFCKAAENKTLCISIVKGATTWQSAAANAISETLKVAKHRKPMLGDLVEALQGTSLSRISKESIEHTCNEIYDFAIECLTGALDDLKYGYKDRLETKLSSVTGPSAECTNSIKKFDIDSQLFEFFSMLGSYASTCLSIAKTVSLMPKNYFV